MKRQLLYILSVLVFSFCISSSLANEQIFWGKTYSLKPGESIKLILPTRESFDMEADFRKPDSYKIDNKEQVQGHVQISALGQTNIPGRIITESLVVLGSGSSLRYGRIIAFEATSGADKDKSSIMFSNQTTVPVTVKVDGLYK